MAFQNVNSPKATKESVKLTELPVGGDVTGYPVSFVESQNYPGTFSILMQDETGEKFYVNTAGNVKYAITDGKIALNVLTKIVRNPDQKMKNGKMVSNFDILQDNERTLDSDSEGFAAITSISQATATEIKAPVAANQTRAAVERASVKAQAQKLQAQATSSGGRK